MAYIGREPIQGQFEKQLLSADGSTTSFALNWTVGSESALLVSVGGVVQEPGVAYNLSGGGVNIVFTAAPASGDRVYVHFLGQAIVQNILDLGGAELILDADNDTTITADTDDTIDIKISDADDFQFTANTFTSLSGSTIKTNTIAETTSASGVTIDGLLIKDSKIGTANSIDSDAYIDASIDLAHMSVNSIDSDQYVDGSIDNAHIADDAIDSEHYADGSIDNAHIADDQIDSEHYVDGSIDTAHIADNQVTLAKMAGLARGKIIYGDSSGDPAALAVGSADTILTHDGTDISWATSTAASKGFAIASAIVFG